MTNPKPIPSTLETIIFHFGIPCLGAAPVAIFSAIGGVVAPAPVAVAVQLCPHLYPLGQQPPPLSAAQVSHPCAQLPDPKGTPTDPMPDPVGATMTIPFVFATVVDADAGQEVRLQSRPTRQQPP